MNAFVADLVTIGAGLVNRVQVGVSQLRRSTPGPALARLTASLAAVAALWAALPDPSLLSGPLSLMLPAAIGVGMAPRTRWVSVVILLTLGVWLLTTIVYQVEPALWRVGLLAAALYLTHAAAALAAVLPLDCVVAPVVLWRWVARVAALLLVSLGFALVALAVADQLPARRSVIGPILGSVIAAALVWLLAGLVPRRGGR